MCAIDALLSFERVFDVAQFVALRFDSSLASPTALPTTCLTAPLFCFADPTRLSLSLSSNSGEAYRIELR
jgi:hypothetical protein